MHHVAHRLGEDKEESRQPNAGKHQEQQVDTSKITPTLRKSLSLLRQTLWKPFRKSAMELDLLPWTGTAPSASSCLAQDALWDRGGHHHIRRSSSRERGHLVLHLLLSCAIADFFRVVIFACHYSRATRPALSQQSGVPPPVPHHPVACVVDTLFTSPRSPSLHGRRGSGDPVEGVDTLEGVKIDSPPEIPKAEQPLPRPLVRTTEFVMTHLFRRRSTARWYRLTKGSGVTRLSLSRRAAPEHVELHFRDSACRIASDAESPPQREIRALLLFLVPQGVAVVPEITSLFCRCTPRPPGRGSLGQRELHA